MDHPIKGRHFCESCRIIVTQYKMTCDRSRVPVRNKFHMKKKGTPGTEVAIYSGYQSEMRGICEIKQKRIVSNDLAQ